MIQREKFPFKEGDEEEDEEDIEQSKCLSQKSIKTKKVHQKKQNISFVSQSNDSNKNSYSNIRNVDESKKIAKLKRLASNIVDGKSPLKFDSLTLIEEWAYSVGHFMNDLTAACWFNYLLYWLKQVLQFQYASYAMLSGQIFDAITTPLVGHFSDKISTRFGKRTPWYIGGTVLVIISFLPVFHCFLPGQIWPSLNDQEELKVLYYIFFPSIFNVGWASVQISHMSLVPSLTVSRQKRDHLNNRRNTFTFAANLVVLCTALILFQTIQDSLTDFEILACIVVGIGMATSAFFMLVIKEQKLSNECEKDAAIIKQILSIEMCQEDQGDIISISSQETAQTTWKEWLKEKQFYHYAFVYMGCRLYCNVTSTMLNFFMVYVLNIATQSEIANKTPMEIALIPLLLYVSSVIMSMSLDHLYHYLGKRKTFSIGGVLVIISSISLALIQPDNGYLLYPIAILIGCTQVLLLNTSITLISEVIGLRGSSGAFVFGAYSFMDKISTGIVLFFISESSLFTSESFIRWTTVLIPLISGIFAWVLIMTGQISDKINLDNTENSNNDDQNEDYDEEESVVAQYVIAREKFSSDSSSGESKKKRILNLCHLVKQIKDDFAN